MKKISELIVKARYFLLGVFVLLIVASCVMMQHVNINYNLMQYLDKDSTSTVALEKMEDEFGSVGQCQVLVGNVSFEDATKIKDKIESIDGVASVIFASSETDTEYYKQDTHDALYKVFLTTGNFDTASYQTLDKIRDELNEYTISLNGGSVESEFLTNSLERDMVIIIAIVIAVVFVILMLASSSFIEPILFLLIAGGAILINMGTNMLLNAIPYIGNAMSFITKSIAAVMQLALSMDYAIVLLHAYKEEKANYNDNKQAMVAALRKAFAPVSASSITTIAGLVALMFMSFSIGFDVGLVLAKGILISLLSVFLFMPGMLLLFDKLLIKTAHRPIDQIIAEKIKVHHLNRKAAGKKIHTMAKFQQKTRIIVPILAAIIFVVGAVFNFNSSYSFTLQASTDPNSTINVDEQKITDEFGTQNTLVVLIDKTDKTRAEVQAEEEAIIKWLDEYRYHDQQVINSKQGYTTYGITYADVTADELANAYSINPTIVGSVYQAMNVEKSNIHDVLQFIKTHNYVIVAMDGVQAKMNSSYSDLVKAGVFDATTGAVNETTVNQMKAYCDACETGMFDLNDATVKAKYIQYKTILNEFNQTSLMATYPFITKDTAILLLNGADTIPNYKVIQAVAARNIASLYGQGLQPVCNQKYEAIAAAAANFESENYIRIIFNFDMPTSSEDSFMAINEISDYIYGEYDNTKLVSETFVYSQIKDVFNQDIVTVNIISFVAILLIIAITFKSAFTPILLTLLIQGAIWVTMGLSTMLGSDIFFICYMVVMCVQMGATIDYGILLTNNYINNRKKYGPLDAMSSALLSSISTILTSGLILVLATLIIGLVSKVSIVADLGLLLSRGCLISILMIVFVLPQCLMICDKIMEKTSIKIKFYHGAD